MIIAYNGTLPGLASGGFGGTSSTPYTYFAVNLNASKGTIGSVLWMKHTDPPAGNISVLMGGVDPVNRVFTEAYKETTQWVGYNMDTGSKLWTTGGQSAFDYYGNPAVPNVPQVLAYGKLYSRHTAEYSTAMIHQMVTYFGPMATAEKATAQTAGQYLHMVIIQPS